MPRILEILLIDRTTSEPDVIQNIIWANDNYAEIDNELYAATSQIKLELITADKKTLIVPRAFKAVKLRKKRTKAKAEVFTPLWVVKMQNDAADADFQEDDLECYVRRKWLEITCGEAPYMATRYDVESGEAIPLPNRTGFVDRKLARINNEVTDKAEWQRLVELAYKSSYGFEWSGDSLLIARENLLYTYRDYFHAKWGELPTIGLFENIAIIISYNIFQMDGLTLTIPLTEKREQVQQKQLALMGFDDLETGQWIAVPGIRVKIMNWDTYKMEYFDEGIEK
jgi:hypothetical protein